MGAVAGTAAMHQPHRPFDAGKGGWGCGSGWLLPRVVINLPRCSLVGCSLLCLCHCDTLMSASLPLFNTEVTPEGGIRELKVGT